MQFPTLNMWRRWLGMAWLWVLVVACGPADRAEPPRTTATPGSSLEFASTFTLAPTDSGTWVTVLQPWKGNYSAQHYFLYPKAEARTLPDSVAGIGVPVERMACYATTQLPYLDLLGHPEALVAFPSTQYISTPSLAARVAAGQVRDIGQDNAVNVETLLDTNPDLVMMYALNAPGDEYEQLERLGTPVLFNADYLEEHPLGRAEYIKLFGALLEEEARADSVFGAIKGNFESLAAKVPVADSPTVFAGVVFGDTWYAPGGDSWAADFIGRAGGKYLFADQPGTGSLQLSFETVYARCLEADFWLNVGTYTEREEMRTGEARYADFEAFEEGRIYNFMKGAVPNGGVPYFEEGYARPDKVLSDVLYILHPPTPQDSLHYYVPVR